MAVSCIHINLCACDFDDDTLGDLSAVRLFDTLNHLSRCLGGRLLDIIGNEHLHLAALGAGVQGEYRDSFFVQALDAGNQGNQVLRTSHDEGINVLGNEVVNCVQDLFCIGLRIHDLELITVFFAGVSRADDESLDEFSLGMLDDHSYGLLAVGILAGSVGSVGSGLHGCSAGFFAVRRAAFRCAGSRV